ncbi:MAG: RNA polymerase sigma factor [Spirochaetota bacterium]
MIAVAVSTSAARVPTGDEELISRLRRGDEDAYRDVVARYRMPLMSLAFKIVGDRTVAEEVVQDTFAAFHRSMRAFNGASKIFTYLYRIATNKSVDAVRKAVRSRTLISRMSVRETKHESHEDAVAVKVVVEEALKRLPGKLRAPLLLVEYERLSYADIAAILGVPVNTVRTRIFRARERLFAEFAAMGVRI